MKTKILVIEEAKNRLKEKIMSDWIVITGNSESINDLENAIYTPGTTKSKYFETFMVSTSLIAIGKKTEDLKHLLGNPPDFDQLLMLVFHINIGHTDKFNKVVTEYIGYTTNKEETVSKIVSKITQQW